MWIMKISRSLSSCNSITTFDFSALYTTILHSKLKDRLRELVQLCLVKKDWPTKIQIPCARKVQILLCKQIHSDSTKKFSETDIINILEFLIDSIFVILDGRVFNKQSAYIWVQPVLLFSPTYPLFVWGRLHTETSQETRKEASPIL